MTPSPTQRTDPSIQTLPRPWWVSLAVFLLCCVWVSVAAMRHTALHHDMAEQFVWAHAWQMGYPKHPPLPTWLFMSVLEIWPARPSTLYALSALCIGATGVFTYLAAIELIGQRLGLCVALLWGLQQPFAWRAWIYNHNTVLVMCIALTLMCTVKAVKQQQGMAWWLAAGVGAALAMSTKLQALVPLLGMVWAVWRGGYLAHAFVRKGLMWAAATATLLGAAPLAWMLTGHTNAMAYATHQFGSGGTESERVQIGHFLTSELRMLAPTLLALLIWVAWDYHQHGTGLDIAVVDQEKKDKLTAWVEGLLFVPMLGVLAMGVLGGATLHAQWGVQTFQFLSLVLVVWFHRLFDLVSAIKLVSVVVVLQLLSLMLASTPTGDRLHAPGAVQGYPSAMLAERVLADWTRVTGGCPLHFVSAPFFEGGQLSAYLSTHPMVLEGGEAANSPWVDLTEMRRQGSVVLVNDLGKLPADAVHTEDMVMHAPRTIRGVQAAYWGIRSPANSCMTNGTR